MGHTILMVAVRVSGLIRKSDLSRTQPLRIHRKYFFLSNGAGALLALLFAAPAFAQVGLNIDVESAVRAEFAEDAPIMIEIARCESKHRQYTDAGNPLYGGYQGRMVGIFQVYSDIHMSYAATLGMDVETVEGNIAYARHLYDREGTRPWLSSMPCWGKEVTVGAQAISPDVLSMNLSMGMEHPQVYLLQKTLNAKGYVIASDGPGSPGNETQKFGALTRAAVKKFQCATMQICDGDEHTNGYGFVGAKTRAALIGASIVATQPAVTQPTTSSTAETTPPPTSTSNTTEEEKQIIELQAQILELTKVLQALLAARAS